MSSALADLNAYKSAHSFSATDLTNIGDFSGDNSVTNADLQGLLNALAAAASGGLLSQAVTRHTIATIAHSFFTTTGYPLGRRTRPAVIPAAHGPGMRRLR